MKFRTPTEHNRTHTSQPQISRGPSGGDTPGHIPNPEVKPSSADGTAGATRWESRSPREPTRPRPPTRAASSHVTGYSSPPHPGAPPSRSAHRGGDGSGDLTPGPCRVRRHRAVPCLGITGSLPAVEVDHAGVGAMRVALARRGQGRRDHRHPRRGCGRSRDRCRASPGRCQGRQPLATAHRPGSVGPPAPPARPEGLSSSRGARSAPVRGPPGWPRGARRWSAGCRRRDGRRSGRRARCGRGRPRRCG
jgi:hypothetical protein